MQTLRLRPDDIEIGERHRALNDAAVARLADSIKAVGLLQPITVRVVEEMEVDGVLTSGVPLLVAGRHRLAAIKSLSWDMVECAEIDDDAIKAELIEIAENLHRLDLTKEQRDEHIRRYAELLVEHRAAIVAQDGEQSRPVGRPKSVNQEVADATGLSRETVRRALKPQADVIPISPRSEQDATLAQFNALMGAWNRAGPEARELFVNEIDGPVFDRTRAGAA